MKCWGNSDTGVVRGENQDAYILRQFENGWSLLLVCDGMGFPLVPDLDDPEAPIRVVVEVDGAAAYEKEHYASEGQISVRLKALEGEHEVRILQNGATVSRQMVNFE